MGRFFTSVHYTHHGPAQLDLVSIQFNYQLPFTNIAATHDLKRNSNDLPSIYTFRRINHHQLCGILRTCRAILLQTIVTCRQPGNSTNPTEHTSTSTASGANDNVAECTEYRLPTLDSLAGQSHIQSTTYLLICTHYLSQSA
jgi:hypothetical protein